MNQKNKKKEIIGIPIYHLLILFVVGNVFMLFPIVLTKFSTIFSLDDEKSAFIGDAIGGITAPLFGLLSSILVYAAFKSQNKANSLIQEQFIQQNEDQLFFRLIDSLNNRITTFTIKTGVEDQISGIQTLDILNRQIQDGYEFLLVKTAKQYFIYNPEQVSTLYFDELYKANIGVYEYNGNMESFKTDFISRPLIEDSRNASRSNFIDNYDEDKKFKFYLKKLGKEKFCNIDIEIRQQNYRNAFLKVYHNYQGFYDSYFNSLKYLIKYIQESGRREFYISFLVENLTPLEKVFIFYCCTTNKFSSEMKNLIYEYKLIQDLINNEHLIVKSENHYIDEDFKFLFDKNKNE